MSSISVRLEEDTDQLLERLKNIQNVDKAGIMNAIAEGLRTSTEERFQSQGSMVCRFRRHAEYYGRYL